MLKVNRATYTHPSLPAEPVGVRKGAGAALYQSTSSSAAKGEFFSLWSVVKTIGRFTSSIFSSIWHLIRCCPSYKFSWLTIELVKPLLDGGTHKLETLTKVRDGVFEVQGNDGKTGEFTFWINEKDELAWALRVDGAKIEEKNLGSSVVFARISEKVPDKVAYFHNGHVGYLRIKEAGNGQYAVDGIAPQEIRYHFLIASAEKGAFIWESHLTKNPDADLSSITGNVVLDMSLFNSITWVDKRGPGEFILHFNPAKSFSIPSKNMSLPHFGGSLLDMSVKYYINTLDELVEVFPNTNKAIIYGTEHFWKKEISDTDYRYLIFDSGKHSFLFQTWNDNKSVYEFTGTVIQGVLDQLAKDELDNSIWIAIDPASTEVLKRNGFKCHEASEAWIRSEEKE